MRLGSYLGAADWPALLIMSVGILFFARPFIDPTAPGIPWGIDLGDDLAYVGTLRSELLGSGRLLTWWSVAHDGIPLIGHPNTQFFYLPFTIPTLTLGAAAGVRVTYVGSLLLAGFGMYLLARLLGPRPFIAAWTGLLFAMSGGMEARIFAGHLQKVLALPLVPLVLGGALMMGRAKSRQSIVLWGLTTGLVHGFTFLAGESFLQIFLFVAVPLIVVIVSKGEAGLSWVHRVIWGLVAWGAGLVVATAGKLVAAVSVLTETVRNENPYIGSEHSYWAIVHLAIPPLPDAFQHTFYGWWEYSQYIGIVPVILAGVACGAVILRISRCESILESSFRTGEVLALLAVIVLGALWLANGFLYSPVHWLYVAVPPLHDFRVPSRALMLTSPAALALGAVGLEAVLSGPRLRAPTIAISFGAVSLIAIWLVNSWAYPGVPGLQELDTLTARLMIVVVAALLLFGAGFIAFRLTGPHCQLVLPVVIAFVGIAALADVYQTTQATLDVGYARSAPELRRVIAALKDRDVGPFLVFLGDFGVAPAAVRFEFADRGISVARRVSPLVPEQMEQHKLIGPALRYRYVVNLSNRAPVGPGVWEPLLQVGDVSAFVNTQASGDAWLITGGKIQPVNVVDAQPGRFVVQATAGPETILVVPANAFSGWRVSIDGAPDFAASEFDGYVAVRTQPGEHKYELYYKAPLLPVVLVLGALPWIVIGALLTWWILTLARQTASDPET